MPRNRIGNRVPLALLLCAGLLLSLVGPKPASLQRVPATPSGTAAVTPSGATAVTPSRTTALVPSRAAPAGGFRWPLDGVPRVVRRFDPPAQPWLAGHRGVDLVGAPGAVVRSAGAGRVRFSGRVAGRPVVSVDHARGLRTTYEPVEPVVRAGDEVSAGDPIGRLAGGHPGCPTPACLHWGLRRGDVYLDPLVLLGLGQVRLLPLAVGAVPR
jgi:murein DD-endopeptidase MepM/ murein hydrolase activator NlpD